MRILLLGSKEYPLGTSDDPLPSGGIEAYIENFVRELSKDKRVEIEIITRSFTGTQKHEKKDNIEIYRVPWVRGFFFRNISFNLMAFLKALRLDFDIIHANGPIAGFFGFIIGAIKKKPIVATPHGLALGQPQYGRGIQFFFSLIERAAYSRASCVVFLSEQEKEVFYKKLGFLPKAWRVILPGIDFTKFENANPESIKKEFNLGSKYCVTFIGRLIEVKGVEYLISAVKEVENNFAVLLVGDGPQREKLERMAKIENKVVFTGSRSDVPNILSATDIFVLPSLSEGLPMSLLEAMASGCACVVTDIGLPVRDRETALVVPPKEPKKLAEAIEALLKDKKLREKLGKNAREEARKFSWEEAAEEYMGVFKSVKL